MSKSVLRSCPSSATPRFPAAKPEPSGLDKRFTVDTATVAATASSAAFTLRLTSSYPGLDTRYTVVVVILVIIIAWLRLRYKLVAPVTVMLATMGYLPIPLARTWARITCPGWSTDSV